jgi:hypothetical protein
MYKNSCPKIPEFLDMIHLTKMSKYVCFPNIEVNIDIWAFLVMSKYGIFFKIQKCLKVMKSSTRLKSLVFR